MKFHGDMPNEFFQCEMLFFTEIFQKKCLIFVVIKTARTLG